MIPRHQRSPKLISAVALASIVVLASGCSDTPPSATPSPSIFAPEASASSGPTGSTESTETPQSTIQDLRQADLGNTSWEFRPHGHSPKTTTVALKDGKSTVKDDEFTLGEIIYKDLNNDGVDDAAAQITAISGNSVDDQWYFWIADEQGPTQITLPIAQMSNCGRLIVSVKEKAKGIEVQDVNRGPLDENSSCADGGSVKSTRIISVEKSNVMKGTEWMPVTVSPARAFGGLCPTPLYPHGDSGLIDFRALPNKKLPDLTKGKPTGIFVLEDSQVYQELFPDWILLGYQPGDTSTQGCAWAQK